MFQRKEIGKYRSIQSQIDVRLNKEYITPDGDHYTLIKFEKTGRNKSFTYQWIENPQHTITSDHILGVEEIVNWIKRNKENIKTMLSGGENGEYPNSCIISLKKKKNK